jgi:hypothetical protein
VYSMSLPELLNNTVATNKLRGLSPRANLYRPSDRRLSAKLVPTSADIE